ncbi:MAG: peptide deformylase [Rhizobiales bacterium 35-68-8]|nr:MAG: peptide deformylase [Rhizobiales bacterium 35-68-8]
MPVRPLVTYPDPRLKAPALPVTAFDAALRDLVTDLTDTMRAAPGIGITGPHMGVLQRVVVLELEPGAVGVYINPVLAFAAPERFRHAEGSVSMPGVTEEIERSARVRITYQDLEGRPCEEAAEGLRAVCHQHEIDQLDGIFWLQRLSRLKRERVTRRFEKLQRPG